MRDWRAVSRQTTNFDGETDQIRFRILSTELNKDECIIDIFSRVGETFILINDYC